MSQRRATICDLRHKGRDMTVLNSHQIWFFVSNALRAVISYQTPNITTKQIPNMIQTVISLKHREQLVKPL